MTAGILLRLVVALAAPLPDGGEVPTVAPALTPAVAPLLAPELVADGGAPVPATLSVYRVDLPIEATLIGASLGVYLITDLLVKPSLQGELSCQPPDGTGRCDPANLSAFDRYAVGKVSRPWTLFSDFALYASIAIPILYLGLESLALPTTEPWGDWAKDLLVIGEAAAVTSALQTLLKFTFRRPRPSRYVEVDGTTGTFDQELSLPSGHTAMVASMTTALTTTVFLRHPRSRVRFVVLGLGIALTALTGFARVESGHHFPTDVITGALVGGFAGFVVPWFHHRRAPVVPTVSFNPADGSARFGVAGHF